MNQVAPITAPAPGPGTSDPDEFQLPMPGLFADLELGAASLRLGEDFLERSGLVQLKVLGDWQRAIARYRRAALQQFAQELSRGKPGMDEAARLELLRATCESLRIELPSDFGALTQAR
jgi:hypothetical protein